MELIYKASALALLSAVVSLLLKKQNPEAALLLSVLTAVGILIAAMGLLNGLQELREQIRKILGGSEVLIAPIMKCLAIAIVTRIAAELCRDSAQNAAAAAVELAGTVCAVSTVMPLLMSVLKMIGGLV
jgi:stage III sporulation protein AD